MVASQSQPLELPTIGCPSAALSHGLTAASWSWFMNGLGFTMQLLLLPSC